MLIDLLVHNPLLLLFITAALGYAIGRIKIKGASLGVAAVLFVGLFIGSFSPDLRLPDFVFIFGLAVFVYTIGLSSGAGFFASFRRKGLRDNLFALVVLVLAAALTGVLGLVFALKPTITAGVYTGSLTNTPAMAGLIDAIRTNAPPDMVDALINDPVVGYSVTYPMGVLGPILALIVMTRFWRINFRKEAEPLRALHLVEQDIYNVTVRVANNAVVGVPLQQLMTDHRWDVVFGRLSHHGELELADGAKQLELGDLVSIVGPPDQVDVAAKQLGELAEEHLDFDRTAYDFRRMFVSNSNLAGRRLSDLQLPQRFDAIVTRIRRGDVDFLATGDTVLELGDRVRVVANRNRMKEVSDFFGDSYKQLSEIDLLSFGLGMSLGLLVGLIPIPLPSGIVFTLGSAGGPLIVGLILGALRRTGPIVWTIPYSANLTLRQMGLIMLLAAIGLKSGYTFVSTFAQSGGFYIFVAGAIVSLGVGFVTLLIGHRLLKIPYGVLTGMLAAICTQPAVLGFSVDQSHDETPNLGYSLIFPIATISKIILAQVLLMVLNRL
jgi:putative transport protein